MTQEWRGIPTRLNNIPHSREIRKYFYDDVLHATKHAIEDKKTRLQVAAYLSNSIYVNYNFIIALNTLKLSNRLKNYQNFT